MGTIKVIPAHLL